MEGQTAQRGRGRLRAQAAALRIELDPVAIDRDQGELDRDEEPVGEDQQEYGGEAEGRVDEDRPVRVACLGESRGRL